MARSHGFLIGQHRVLHQHMAFGPGDVDLPTLPVFLLHSLASGATCVLADADLSQVGRVDADPLIAQINRLSITSTSGSPAFFRQLADKLNARGETLPSVRHAFTGGARVSPELVDDLAAVLPNADIHIVYGSTECEPIAVLDAKAHRNALATTANGALVGRPVEAVTLRIDGEPVGEILVAGPHVNPGYVNNPEADRAHKLHEGGRIWHRTGDVGRIDERGMLWLVGRVGEAVNGLWPLAVEATVESLDFVVRAGLVECKGEAVLALELNTPPEDWAQRIGAMVNARPVAVDRIPVDARHNAKVDRRLLHEQLTQAL
jgi:acyl-CoA synthetase (AMP-forming)/AMP-acid ligase II